MPPPPGWGSDSLSKFLEDAYRNRFATFANKRPWFEKLSKIDACFALVAKDWLNPISIVTPLLYLRSHAKFRAACEHALAGQVAEIFPELRASLEYAGYALHIHKNSSLEEIWLRRHDDKQTLKVVNGEFTVTNIRKTIETSDRKLAAIFDELYQRAIDFGGHPNERSITSSLTIIEHADRKEMQQIYLHADGLILDYGLKTSAQVGLCALKILQEVFTARFELLGVRAKIWEIQKGL